jgi:hypothetical protein
MPSQTDFAIAVHVIAVSATFFSIITLLIDGDLQRSTVICIVAVRTPQ